MRNLFIAASVASERIPHMAKQFVEDYNAN